MLNRILVKKEYLPVVISALLLSILLIIALYQVNLTNKLLDKLSYKQSLLKDLTKLESKYHNLQQQKSHTVYKTRGLNLFSLIDRTTRIDKLSNNVVFIRPFSKTINSKLSMDLVEIKLKDMSSASCTRFLYDIEEKFRGRVFLKRIQIKKTKNKGLEINAVFFTYNKKAGRK